MQDAFTISFISCCFVRFYISRYHFHYFLELYATSVKKIFVKNFPFLTDSLNPPHPFNDQNLLTLKKVFCQCSLLPKGLIFDYACQAPPSSPLKSATPQPLLLLSSPPYYSYRLFILWKKSQIFYLTSKILKFFILPPHFHLGIF